MYFLTNVLVNAYTVLVLFFLNIIGLLRRTVQGYPLNALLSVRTMAMH